MSASGPSVAPDEVNLPMIRHWVDALDDQNPIYLVEDFAAKTRHAGIVAPPAMLQTWTMPRPKIEGIAERGGAPGEISFDNPVSRREVALMPNAELRPIPSIWGHMAGSWPENAADIDFVDDAVQELLAS